MDARMIGFASTAAALAACVGCSAKLTVSEALADNDGVPFRVDVPVVVSTTRSFRALPVGPINQGLPPAQHLTQDRADALCAIEQIIESVASAPVGSLHYVNIQPALLASNELSLEWSDAGRIRKIGMNTDPAATIKESAAALSTLLPFVGVRPSSTAESGTAQASPQVEIRAQAGAAVATAQAGPLDTATARSLFCVEIESTIKMRRLELP